VVSWVYFSSVDSLNCVNLFQYKTLRKHYSGEAGASTPQPEDVDFKFAFVSVDISEAGDMAAVIAEFDISSLAPGGTFNDSGVILMVLRRVDNEWKIFAENVSSGPVASFD